MLTIQQKKNRVQRCRALIKRCAVESYRKILFTDEKIFTVEEKFNKQNDIIYAKNKSDIPLRQSKSKRAHHPSSVMVWVGVSWTGKANLVFVPHGVKVRAKNYLESILIPIVEPLGDNLFENEVWTFQQDYDPVHKAKVVQNASPDLNPLDYSIWSKLEGRVCARPHTSLDSLKSMLKKEWDRFPMEVVRASIDEWIPRLRRCVKAKGGNFED